MEEKLHPINDSNQIYSKKFQQMGFSTRAIHSGQQPDLIHGGVSTPIDLSTTFAQIAPGELKGKYDYSRAGNATRTSLEIQMAALEGGKYSQIFSSGLAATSAVITLLEVGDEVLCIDDVYGGTQRLFRKISAVSHGVVFRFEPLDDLETVKPSLSKKTKLVWLESPTNPTLKVTDLKKCIEIIKEFNKDIIVCVDNTFLSPFNCNPLSLGADIVVHSGTKYLGGHSDIIMGMVITNNSALNDRLYYLNKCIGAVPSPFDCYMMIRGIKTLGIRMAKANTNALAVASYLTKHKKVEKVLYPGLPDSKYHEVQKKQLRKGEGVGFGGVVSCYLKLDLKQIIKFIQNVKVWILAESLGAVESLINHPALMTHASVDPENRKKLGIHDNFIRFSVGIEDLEDLIGDLEQAFDAVDNEKNNTKF